MATNKETIYTFFSPFVVTGLAGDFLYAYLSAEEKEEFDSIKAQVLKFAVDQGIIKQDGNTVSLVIVDDTGHWIWHVQRMEMRSLVDLNQYSKLLGSLQNRGGDPLNQIINLHVRLGSLFDPILLNTVVNRVLQAIQIIPYDTSTLDGQTIDWNRIHEETPFIWLIIFLQTIIRSSINPG